MSYLIRTGNNRNNISWSTTENSTTRYLRRTASGRNNVTWTTIPSGSTYNILQRNGTGKNNILWSNLKIEFMSYLAPRYYYSNSTTEISSSIDLHIDRLSGGISGSFWGDNDRSNPKLESGQAINDISATCFNSGTRYGTWESRGLCIQTFRRFADYNIFNKRLKILFNDIGWYLITSGFNPNYSSHSYQIRLVIESYNFFDTDWNNKFSDETQTTKLSILY